MLLTRVLIARVLGLLFQVQTCRCETDLGLGPQLMIILVIEY